LEAKLRLVELPKVKGVLVVHFTDLLSALGATSAVLTHRPAAVEVLDKFILDTTRANAEAARLRGFLHGDPGAVLIIELYASHTTELDARLDELATDLREQGLGYHVHRATDAAEQARIWKLRKMALGVSMCQKGDGKAVSFVEDTAVDPQNLRNYIAEFLSLVARQGTTAGVYAHASVGCLHVRPVINLKTDSGVRQFEAIASEVADLVLKYGGSLSGEHGDGLVRSPFQEKMFGPALYGAFQKLKQTFDPQNLLNPGKIVNAPPLTANLRYGVGYVTPEISTTFDFTADGGVVRAAELCSGVGACRKKREGTMCPSFRATCDEQHSTRGRANALRLALTGQLSLAGFSDPLLHSALDLCLECKACKTECPTNVDMARLKAEFLDHYFRKHGLPWRNWLFSQLARLQSRPQLGSAANWLARRDWFRWFAEVMFGIDRRRSLPVLARKDFRSYLNEEPSDSHHVALGAPALFFPDTFLVHFQPELARDAVRVLRSAGYVVVVGRRDQPSDAPAPPGEPAGLRCCGRPLISNGMLSQAVEHARHNVERLYPWVVDQGGPIVACEPSCILTMKDDYPALLRGQWRSKAEAVAAFCQTFEECVESRLSRDLEADARMASVEPLARRGCDLTSGARLDARPGLQAARLAQHGTAPGMRDQDWTLGPGPKKILVHAHCHERSLTGVETSLQLLRRIPGAEVIDLDCGCCGMAGSFGYEKEHYEISRLVGEHRLFPALRQAEADTAIVAAGFSCRSQIRHFTNRTALHPAELLNQLLPFEPMPQL
jgi:Fe-S oxidoreductase